MIKFDITGTNELQRMFKSLAENVQKDIVQYAINEVALDVKDVMVQMAPESPKGARGNKRLPSRNHPSGNLKKSIKVIMSANGGRNYPTAWVKPYFSVGGPDIWYYRLVEEGHVTRAGKGRGKTGKIGRRIRKGEAIGFIQPNPFVNNTYNLMKSQIVQDLDTIITSEIKKRMTA